MKIVGGRKFALNKHDRPMVIKKKRPRAMPASHRSKTHWMCGSWALHRPCAKSIRRLVKCLQSFQRTTDRNSLVQPRVTPNMSNDTQRNERVRHRLTQ